MLMKYMKEKNLVIVLVGLIFLITSCDADNDKGINFYNAEYRKGLWINATKSDTLEFVDNFNLIRKGTFFPREEFSYRIEDNILVIILMYQNEELKSQHPIMIVDEGAVKLGNMHISPGFRDNSATFYKD